MASKCGRRRESRDDSLGLGEGSHRGQDQSRFSQLPRFPIQIFEYSKCLLLQTSSDTVVCGSFHPDDDRVLITAGKQHLYFWRIINGRILRDKKSGAFKVNSSVNIINIINIININIINIINIIVTRSLQSLYLSRTRSRIT